MAIRVRIPAALERYAPERDLASDGDSVRAALLALPTALRTRVLDEAGRLRPHLLVFVAGRAAALTDPLSDGDLVEIVAAVEGG